MTRWADDEYVFRPDGTIARAEWRVGDVRWSLDMETGELVRSTDKRTVALRLAPIEVDALYAHIHAVKRMPLCPRS